MIGHRRQVQVVAEAGLFIHRDTDAIAAGQQGLGQMTADKSGTP